LKNSKYQCDSFSKIVCILCILAAFFVFLPVVPSGKVFGHAGEVSNRSILGNTGGMENHGENELLIMSRFVPGHIDLSPDPTLPQWKESFENNLRSSWGRDVSVRTINNGSYIFFLLSWDDPTIVPIETEDKVQKGTDGSAIIFERPVEKPINQEKSNSGVEGEPAKEIKDSWYWSTKSPTSAGMITKAEEHNGSWNVVFGREIQRKSDNGSSISFQPGVREEGFVKFVVWDGSKGESFEQINDETLPHYDFMLLPEINIYPKDVYIWSAVLAACGVLFLFVEQKLYKVRDIKVRKR
jgi:hypothetical protein